MNSYNKIILHIPHSSMDIPAEAEGQYINHKETKQTLIELTDVHTDELFSMNDKRFGEVVFPYSRTYCDTERFLDDSKEPMSKKGMGVLYTKGVNGIVFRKFNEIERDTVIALYKEHHKKVEDIILSENLLGETPLIVDCHSFSNKRYKNDGLISDELPDFCVGFNSGNTYPIDAVNLVKEELEHSGFRVLLNNPFSGSLYYDALQQHSLMIEVNKKLYTTDGLTKGFDFYKIRSLIGRILKKLIK